MYEDKTLLPGLVPERDSEEQDKELAMHIHAALCTPSGRVLRDWLREHCFMTTPTMYNYEISDAMQTARIEARRDLYILLMTYYEFAEKPQGA